MGRYSGEAAPKRKTKQKRKFSRFLFWLLLVVFFGICAYLSLFSPFLDIEKVSIEGNQDISSIEIANVVEKSLEGNFFMCLPKRNFFLASKRSIASAVRENFGRLEVVTIEKKFPKALLIKVTERKAELVWCSAGVCYFVDKNGLVYSGAAGNEEELRSRNFLVVVDDSASPVEIGKTKINSEYVGYLEATNAMIRYDLKIDVAGSYHTPGIASQEVSVSVAEGWILKLSSETPVEETKKIIEAIFEKELSEEQRKKLEYFDLRVKGKIYYKLKTQS